MKNEATDFVENKPDSKRPGKNEPKKSSPKTRDRCHVPLRLKGGNMSKNGLGFAYQAGK